MQSRYFTRSPQSSITPEPDSGTIPLCLTVSLRSLHEQMRAGIIAARACDANLSEILVVPYMRGVSDQVRMLCAPSRMHDVDKWLSNSLSYIEARPSTLDSSTKVYAAAESDLGSCHASVEQEGGAVVELEDSARPSASQVDAAQVSRGGDGAGKAGATGTIELGADDTAHGEPLSVLLLRFFRTGFEVPGPNQTYACHFSLHKVHVPMILLIRCWKQSSLIWRTPTCLSC